MLLPFEKRLWSAIPFSKSRTPIPPWGFLLSYITISWYYFCLFMFLWWELEPSICYESHDQTKVLKGWPQRQSGKPITFMASNYKNSTISFRKFGHVGRSWTPTYPRHPWKWTFKLQTHKFNKMTQIPSSFICFHMLPFSQWKKLSCFFHSFSGESWFKSQSTAHQALTTVEATLNHFPLHKFLVLVNWNFFALSDYKFLWVGH